MAMIRLPTVIGAPFPVSSIRVLQIMDNLHPVERAALEQLHLAQRISRYESNNEYGRLLKAWMESNGDGILRNWYLDRIDQAQKVSEMTKGWTRLNRFFKSRKDDLDFFRTVIQLEAEQLALDKNGNWYVQSPAALEIAESRLDQERVKRSELTNIALVLILFIGLIVLARCA